MSFWRTFGFHTVSPIDTLLEKPDCTVQELYDEDDFLQECKSQNRRLIDFLTEPAHLDQVISFLSDDPPDPSDEKRSQKYPFLSSELLSGDVWQLTEAVYAHPTALQKVYSFLSRDTARPAPPLMSTYCTKVAAALMQRKIPETLAMLRNMDRVVAKFVEHLDSPGVLDLLLKIVTADEGTGVDVYGTVKWLCDEDLVGLMMERFARAGDSEVHETVAQAMMDLIAATSPPSSTAVSPIITQLESEAVVSRLLDLIFKGGEGSLLQCGLGVMIELLRKRRLAVYDETTPAEQQPALVKLACSRLDDLRKLLETEDKGYGFELTFGILAPPLGLSRQRVLEFLQAVVQTNNSAVFEALLGTRTLSVAVELFFRYQWNSLLHQTVYEMVVAILSSPHLALRRHLLVDCGLLAKILEAEEANSAEWARTHMSRGYIGHLTKISSLINSLATGIPMITPVNTDTAPLVAAAQAAAGQLAQPAPHPPQEGQQVPSPQGVQDDFDDGVDEPTAIADTPAGAAAKARSATAEQSDATPMQAEKSATPTPAAAPAAAPIAEVQPPPAPAKVVPPPSQQPQAPAAPAEATAASATPTKATEAPGAKEGEEANDPPQGDAQIEEILQGYLTRWKEYTEGPLAERTKLESQLLGGARPTVLTAGLQDELAGAMAGGENGMVGGPGALANLMYRIGEIGSGAFEQADSEDDDPAGIERRAGEGSEELIGETTFDPSDFEAASTFSTDERPYGFGVEFDEVPKDDQDTNSSSSESEDEDEDEDEEDGDEEDGDDEGEEDREEDGTSRFKPVLASDAAPEQHKAQDGEGGETLEGSDALAPQSTGGSDDLFFSGQQQQQQQQQPPKKPEDTTDEESEEVMIAQPRAVSPVDFANEPTPPPSQLETLVPTSSADPIAIPDTTTSP